MTSEQPFESVSAVTPPSHEHVGNISAPNGTDEKVKVNGVSPQENGETTKAGNAEDYPLADVSQPQNTSTIPWPLASVPALNMPGFMASPDPFLIGNMVLYPAYKLGKGAHGRVISAFDVSRTTGEVQEVAVKVSGLSYQQEFARECHAMAVLNGTGVFPQLFAAGQSNDGYFIVMEKFKTTLHAHLCIQRRLGYVGIHSQKLPAVVKEILLLILEMHRRNMVHFDIKPRNILVAEDGRMALTDPAFCHTFQERKPVGEMPFKGTTFFMAPEILRGFEVDDARPADMYSLGMTIAMARGVKLPSGIPSLDELEDLVDSAFPPDYYPLANDFLTRLVVMGHDKRMTAGEALNHRWLEECTIEPRDIEWMKHLDIPQRRARLLHPGYIEEIVLTNEDHVRSVSSIMRGF